MTFRIFSNLEVALNGIPRDLERLEWLSELEWYVMYDMWYWYELTLLHTLTLTTLVGSFTWMGWMWKREILRNSWLRWWGSMNNSTMHICSCHLEKSSQATNKRTTTQQTLRQGLKRHVIVSQHQTIHHEARLDQHHSVWRVLLCTALLSSHKAMTN